MPGSHAVVARPVRAPLLDRIVAGTRMAPSPERTNARGLAALVGVRASQAVCVGQRIKRVYTKKVSVSSFLAGTNYTALVHWQVVGKEAAVAVLTVPGRQAARIRRS